MTKKTTLKQRKFIKFYFETNGNASEAARLAGYRQDMSGRRLLRNATVLAEIERIKKENGLTDELLLQKHLQLLNAKKVQSCNIYVRKDSTGKWVIEENQNEFIEVDDNATQLGALKLAYQIQGKIKEVKEFKGEVEHRYFFEEVIKKSQEIEVFNSRLN